MSSRKVPLQKLTVFLLKEGVSRTGALRDPDELASHRVNTLSPDEDSLFVAGRPPRPPRWQSFLDPHVEGSLSTLLSASASAVLLFESENRLFAVTFGHGRHLLDPESFEQDFGLKVVLNSVAPDQLKSVDAKTVDDTTVHTRRDVSRDSSLSAFGLDVSRDLLRAVTGTPKDETLAHRLTGADALGIHTRTQLPELPSLGSRLLTAYDSDAYRENFEFIDHLRPERRPEKIRELETELVRALNARAIDDLHLAAPETLDWLDIAGFRLSTLPAGQPTAADPQISAYLDSHDGDLDIEQLKRDRLFAIASTGEIKHSWTILRCLVYEVTVAGELFVLSAGQWFRVGLPFKNQVYADVAKLPTISVALPVADAGTDEARYNAKAAKAIGGLCLDRKLVRDGGPDSIEICDILTPSGGLIHVKQRGSSSTLSHLFAQGVNSAERLLNDDDFREQARALVTSTDGSFPVVIPAERPPAEAHEISFAVITRSDRSTPLTLPFFSVVSLRAAASRLHGFGFKVTVAAVREASA